MGVMNVLGILYDWLGTNAMNISMRETCQRRVIMHQTYNSIANIQKKLYKLDTIVAA